jgi:hypothetical protein
MASKATGNKKKKCQRSTSLTITPEERSKVIDREDLAVGRHEFVPAVDHGGHTFNDTHSATPCYMN